MLTVITFLLNCSKLMRVRISGCFVHTMSQNLEPCLVHSHAWQMFVERKWRSPKRIGPPNSSHLSYYPQRNSQSGVSSKPKSDHVSFLLFTSQDKSQTLPHGFPGPSCSGPFLPLSSIPLAPHTPVALASLRSSDVVPSASFGLWAFAHTVPRMHPQFYSLPQGNLSRWPSHLHWLLHPEPHLLFLHATCHNL